MEEILLRGKTLCLFGLKRRRIRIWTASVLAIVTMLGIQAALPGWALPGGLASSWGAATFLAVFLTALCCEYIDSSLGMGYGTTLTPLLLVAGFEPMQVVPCVLLSEFVTGITAGLMHQHDGNVDFLGDRRALSTALLLSVLGAAGALAAVVFALQLPTVWLKAVIAVIVFSVGLVILATFRRKLEYRRGHIIALGALAAFNKGLSGGGYGPLVTSGQIVSGMSPKHAIAITSLAEAWTCLVGLAAYVLLRGTIDWSLAVPLTLGAMLSVPMATLTVRHMQEGVMRWSVGTLTCALGIAAMARLLF